MKQFRMCYDSSNQPLVSICIPTYNRRMSLERAVDYARKGTYRNIEIIIADNCSTDDTEKYCNKLCSQDARIRYYRQSKNVGPNANFNFVMKMAIGKYFMFHADDDYLETDFVERCVKFLERNDSYVLASGLAAFKHGKEPIKRYGNVVEPTSAFSLKRLFAYWRRVSDNSIFCGIYARDRVRECRIPNILGGDWAWMSEVLLLGRAKMLPDVFIIRDYGNNISASYERIVQVIGAPRWQARFANFAIARNLALFLLTSSIVFRKRATMSRIIVSIVSFSTIYMKLTSHRLISFLGSFSSIRGTIERFRPPCGAKIRASQTNLLARLETVSEDAKLGD